MLNGGRVRRTSGGNSSREGIESGCDAEGTGIGGAGATADSGCDGTAEFGEARFDAPDVAAPEDGSRRRSCRCGDRHARSSSVCCGRSRRLLPLDQRTAREAERRRFHQRGGSARGGCHFHRRRRLGTWHGGSLHGCGKRRQRGRRLSSAECQEGGKHSDRHQCEPQNRPCPAWAVTWGACRRSALLPQSPADSDPAPASRFARLLHAAVHRGCTTSSAFLHQSRFGHTRQAIERHQGHRAGDAVGIEPLGALELDQPLSQVRIDAIRRAVRSLAITAGKPLIDPAPRAARRLPWAPRAAAARVLARRWQIHRSRNGEFRQRQAAGDATDLEQRGVAGEPLQQQPSATRFIEQEDAGPVELADQCNATPARKQPSPTPAAARQASSPPRSTSCQRCASCSHACRSSSGCSCSSLRSSTVLEVRSGGNGRTTAAALDSPFAATGIPAERSCDAGTWRSAGSRSIHTASAAPSTVIPAIALPPQTTAFPRRPGRLGARGQLACPTCPQRASVHDRSALGVGAQRRPVASPIRPRRNSTRQRLDGRRRPGGKGSGVRSPAAIRRCSDVPADTLAHERTPGGSARSRAARAAPARAAPAARSSGWPIRMICSSLRSLVSRLVSSRSCSSTSADRFCASSITSTLLRPAACASSRKRVQRVDIGP